MVIRYSPVKAREKFQKTRATEQQIMAVYEEAPVERTRPARGKPIKKYYKPTPEQEEKIIELAMKLPPEKRTKYVTYEPVKEEPKGIAETLVSISYADIVTGVAGGVLRVFGVEEPEVEKRLATVKPYVTILQPKLVTGKPMPMFGEPVKALGAAVAPFEQVAYGGERLVSAFITHHEPVTPRPPPTTTGGIIGAVLGDPSELEKVQEYGPSYMMGSLLGDIALSYFLGKGVEKAWGGLKKIPVVRKGPEFAEKVTFKLVGKLPKRVQSLFIREEVVGYKRTPSMVIARSESWAKGTQFVSGTVHTPYAKTLAKVRGGLMLFPPYVEEMQRTILPTLTFRMVVTPLTETVTRQWLRTAFVAPMFLTKGILTPRLRGALVLKERVKPQRLMRTVQAPKQVQRQRLRQFQLPILKQVQKQRLTLFQDVAQAQKVMVGQLQIQKQIQLQKRIYKMRYKFPEVFKKRKRGKGLFGAWIPKTHPIPTPKEIARSFSGIAEPRKRKRKGKRRRKKPLRFTF